MRNVVAAIEREVVLEREPGNSSPKRAIEYRQERGIVAVLRLSLGLVEQNKPKYSPIIGSDFYSKGYK